MEAIHRVLVNVASSDWEEVAEDPPLVRYLGCRASRASQRNSTLGLQLCGGVAHRCQAGSADLARKTAGPGTATN